MFDAVHFLHHINLFAFHNIQKTDFVPFRIRSDGFIQGHFPGRLFLRPKHHQKFILNTPCSIGCQLISLSRIKRSNCLQSINSADKNIILTFVLLSLIASLSKTYCGIKAMLKKNIQWISMLKLHKLNTAFSKLFRSLQSLKLSSIYQIFKELFDEISMHCQRTTPSNRDRVLLKDLPLLVWQIVNQPNPFDNNVLRS